MLTITFKVYTPTGNTFQLRDYIVMESLWKLKRLAQAVGSEAAFERGEFFASDYTGRNLTLELKVEQSAEFGDQNKIKAYKPAKLGGKPSPFNIGQRDPVKNADNPPIDHESADIPF